MSVAQSKTIGRPILRKEDERLLRGAGCYADDVNLPGQVYACMVRSPHAHARIKSISTEVPGAIAVLTGKDAFADGLQPIPTRPVTVNPHEVKLQNRDGTPFHIPPYPALPVDEVRFVGQAVAVVIAATPMAAKDGADAVEVDYGVLAPGSAVLVDADVGNDVQKTFATAAHVVKLETTINRITGVPLEPRAVVASFADGRYTIHAPTGSAQRFRADAAAALGVPESAVRFVAREVGGSYGTRNYLCPEIPLVAWAAKRLGRPVKWRAERQECFLSDDHARALSVQAELALDKEGNFLGFRSTNTSNVGAYPFSYIPLTKGVGVATSVYHLPCAAFRARAVSSNTMATSPYRAAGRPEVMFVIERLIDLAARKHGFDRAELRLKNLIRSFPYRNNQGLVYDSGDYPAVQKRALELAEWSSFEKRRSASRARGKLRGIGMGHYIELNTGAPRERAQITVKKDGTVDVVLGTISSGQGHETSFAQLVADWLGVDMAQVRFHAGDTDVASVGGGTHSGRSMRMGAVVIDVAVKRIVEKGKQAASDKLEAAVADIEYVQGKFRVKGTDRAIGLFELAPLAGEHDNTDALPSYAFGCAVCEVEIDPETGVVEVVRYTSVDDVGRAVNPLIIHGQTHGGIVAGVGQALMERIVYDADGQLQTASFMDYAMPRADQFAFFTTDISEVPAASHPLGMRGGGEGGTTPSLATVANAVCDALGIDHIELPATPERVWRKINTRE
ncbi:MAG TPA: xanthine dehydrogenase family protein molybdopterin-binding subunit [Burkholderiales bacterium]|nr:xanthine dehydrogenase family protein molybdopterin-binding subunit [Burkholderiales bacterium]